MKRSFQIGWWKSTLSLMVLLIVGQAFAQTTSFTYQGRLNDAGNPATGVYDLQFRLFDALSSGNQAGPTLTQDDMTVTSGSFSVTLDFGAAAFPGANRWLEISVRPGASAGAFTALSPRQPITPTPYAIKSANATAADTLSAACTGCVTSAQIGSLPASSGNYIQNTNTQQASSNFNISGNGVIGGTLGIGTGTAITDGVIHAIGQNPVRILGETTTLIADEIVDFFARSTNFNSELGGMRIQRQPATGNIDTLFFAAQAGNQATEKMRITGTGFLNVSGGGTFTGLNGDGAVLTARRTTGDSYFVLDSAEGQNAVLALRKNNLNRWLMFADNTNSNFRLDGYGGLNGDGTYLFINRDTGNVGIGTTTPSTSKLEVNLLGNNISKTAIYGFTNSFDGTGVSGIANSGPVSYGVYGQSTDGYAGYFSGKVHVTGTLSKGAGSFKIDHPLDPENKYLYHSFVESPDMMNLYNGNITTDTSGEATVTMPEWFEALNADFRYQLTVIGQFAQAIVSEEISGNQFKIRTSLPNVKVSWQVTGVRHDAFANQHRIPVEELKPQEERGTYLHPDAFKQPAEKGLVQHQLQSKRMIDTANKQSPEKQ